MFRNAIIEEHERINEKKLSRKSHQKKMKRSLHCQSRIRILDKVPYTQNEGGSDWKESSTLVE